MGDDLSPDRQSCSCARGDGPKPEAGGYPARPVPSCGGDSRLTGTATDRWVCSLCPRACSGFGRLGGCSRPAGEGQAFVCIRESCCALLLACAGVRCVRSSGFEAVHQLLVTGAGPV